MLCIKAPPQTDQIWHPFVQRALSPSPLPIIKAKGCTLYAEDGQTFLDGISSWWVNLHGHCHPYITAAITKQMEAYDQFIFTDFTHEKALELARRLLQTLPKDYGKLFFTDNGSTAVEAALKMVIQYWKNLGVDKQTIIAFEGGYHGDTFGAMSLGRKSTFTLPFRHYLFEVHSIPPPFPGQEERSIEALKRISNGACFIFEPLIQGVGGMRIHSKEGLEALLEECNKREIITIADEVMTGFGRTGPLFVSSTLKQKPDLIALAKGITGGILPLGVTICKEKIHAPFVSKNRKHTFLHGHSYTGNPIACAAALANLDLTLTSSCDLNRFRIAHHHKRFVKKWKGHSKLKRVESIGTILALELNTKTDYDNPIREQLLHFFSARGILLRPFGNVLHVLPPYCITNEELNTIYQAIEEGLAHDFRL